MNIKYQTFAQQNFRASTEEEIVKLILKDTDFMVGYSEFISPQLFRDKYRPIVESSVKYWKQYGGLIPPEVLVQDLNKSVLGVGKTQEKEDALKQTVAAIVGDPIAPDYTKDMVTAFIRMQRMENALTEAVHTFNFANDKQDYNSLDKIVESVNRASEPFVFNQPEFFVKELDVRLERRKDIAEGILKRDGIGTGIPGIDKRMPYGGPERGQLCMFLAPTGRGKSIALKHCSYAAALQGLSIVYFSLELPKDMLLDRMDSMVSKIPIHQLIEERNQVKKEIDIIINEIPLENGFGEIAFLECPCSSTVHTFRNELTHLKRRYQFEPDVIVVDYMDLMISTRRFKEGAWRDQQEVARELRAFGAERKALVWTASQTNRSAINKVEEGEMISDAEAAESYSKQSVADLIISLNQTKEQRAFKTDLKPMTLYFVKNRTGQGGIPVEILTDFSRMCFYAGDALGLEEEALKSGAFVDKV
jgi:replicative DNA helicase